MSRAPLLLTLSVSALLGCRSPEPERPAPRAAVPRQVLDRFDLTEASGDEAATLEPIHVLGRSEDADLEGIDAPTAGIELDDVLRSVGTHFPLILAAEEEIEVAAGRLLAAQGGFDPVLGSDGYFRVDGFRETERLDVFVEQPTPYWGASLESGYRFGLGEFDFYEEGAQTNESGEVRLGLNLPLLQGRAIDPRRVSVWKARLDREQADPMVRAKRLAIARAATHAYWKWVVAGRLREISTRLLALADDRTEQLIEAVDEGLLPPINLTENERLVVDRRARLVRAERKLQEAAIALSLYWRDAEGRPRVPSEDLLPYEFPAPRDPEMVLLPFDEEFALEQRPEVTAIQLDLAALRVDEQLAENRLLPRLDVGVIGSQDLGTAASDPDDKSDFELALELDFGVPLRLRTPRGLQREVRAEIRQLNYQAQFLSEAIVTDVQDTRSALVQSWLGIEQARRNVDLANELAEAERFQLTVGESDLLRVNLREQQAAVAAAGYVEVLRGYFDALADYRAALGVLGDWNA